MDNNNFNQNNNGINNLNNQLNRALQIIEQQNKTINELQNKLKNNVISTYNINFNNNNITNPNDKIIINFISLDNNIHFTVSCLKTNLFAEIEAKLYEIYPQYREKNNTFVANGVQILRFKTIAENNLDNGTTVALILSS